MEFRRIPDDDSVYRQCIYPWSFKVKQQTFVPEKCMRLVDQGDLAVTSVYWERFVPTPDINHEYGCRLAQHQNDKKRSEGKYSDAKRSIYCGAYLLGTKAIRAIPATPGISGIQSADVLHCIEEGEIAHANLAFCLDPDDREGTKTAIVDRLWNLSKGPLRHKCECDQNDNPHYSTKLLHGPAGEYSDSRTGFSRGWRLVRFWLLSWTWKYLFRKKVVRLPTFVP